LRVAAIDPNRVRALVLVDFGPDLDEASMRHSDTTFIAGFQTYASAAEYALLLRAQRPLAPPGLIESLAMSSLRAGATGAFELKCDPALARDDYRPDSTLLWKMLRAIHCPVLVVRGAGSAIFPRRTAERMLHVLSNGRGVAIPRAGHAVMVDNFPGFAEAVCPFMLACCKGY
jgi:pimeloyl-ACP methyl ester carboxylesterase